MQIYTEEPKKFGEQTCDISFVKLHYHAVVFNEIKVMLEGNICDALKNISFTGG